MIATIIASALLFVAVKLMLDRHERHIEHFRRDLDSIRQALEDTQSDLLTVNGNVLNTYGMLQQLKDKIDDIGYKTNYIDPCYQDIYDKLNLLSSMFNDIRNSENNINNSQNNINNNEPKGEK